MAKIVLKNLKKHFGDFFAVKDFNLNIQDGEFVIFVGPSGCGKTTTLRMIAGLEDCDEGEIYIGDRLVNELAPKDRNVSMVFQNYALYPHMDVYRNLAFGLKLRKVPKQEIETRVKRTAKILDLEELLDRKPKQLSGGQMQRVALGRAIVRDPDVFLFDEPLSNLDAKLRARMRNELSILHHQLQATMVYVTHDQVEAMTMGDRIVVMKDGLIQQVGTPREVYEHPSNLFVAGFIGSPTMNFIDGVLVEEKSLLLFKNDDVLLQFPPFPMEKIKPFLNQPVSLGLRPDNVTLCGSESNGLNCVAAQVEVVEYLGSEIFITASVKGTSFKGKMAGGAEVRIGQNVFFHFDLSKAHLFEQNSGICFTSN